VEDHPIERQKTGPECLVLGWACSGFSQRRRCISSGPYLEAEGNREISTLSERGEYKMLRSHPSRSLADSADRERRAPFSRSSEWHPS
jgi:hypothetical protein